MHHSWPFLFIYSNTQEKWTSDKIITSENLGHNRPTLKVSSKAIGEAWLCYYHYLDPRDWAPQMMHWSQSKQSKDCKSLETLYIWATAAAAVGKRRGKLKGLKLWKCSNCMHLFMCISSVHTINLDRSPPLFRFTKKVEWESQYCEWLWRKLNCGNIFHQINFESPFKSNYLQKSHRIFFQVQGLFSEHCFQLLLS